MTNEQAPSATVDEECKTCNGTGNEICDNPDHGLFLSPIFEGHANGCPCCGHDELHRIKGTVCQDCNGTGKLHSQQPTVDVEEPKLLSKEFLDGFERGKAEALRGTYTRADMIAFAYYYQTSNDELTAREVFEQFILHR